MNADLFSSDNGLETALLRSSLAFGINQELQGSRSQFLSQIISSLIMAEGPMSADDICRQFKRKRKRKETLFSYEEIFYIHKR